MSFIIKDTVAIVTGAVGGLGSAIARALLDRGAQVCLTDIEDVKGHEIITSLIEEYGEKRAIYCHCDVTKENDFVDVFKTARTELGPVQIMCNNAGLVAEFDISKMVDVNLKGVYYGTAAAVAAMRKDRGGRGGVVVNIASDTAVYPVWMIPGYSGTKAAVLQYTKSWSLNPGCETMGLRFNTLCPIAMQTGWTDSLAGNALDVKEMLDYDEVHGYVKVDDVAQAFCRLVEGNDNGEVVMVTKEGEQCVKQTYTS